MSQNPQNPYPHDPFGQEPAAAGEQGAAGEPAQPSTEGSAPWAAEPGASADPAPEQPAPGAPAEGAYDPYAQPGAHDASGQGEAAGSPYGQQSPYGQPSGEPNYYAPTADSGAAHATGPTGEQAGAGWSAADGAAGGAYAGGAAGGAYAGGAAGGQQVPGAAPTVKGVFDGQLTGQPVSDSDSRLWAMFSQLSVVVGHLLSWGFLGWLGPLIIFLVYKDRDRFVRYNAAEALNGAIAVVIAQVVLAVVLGIFGVVTLGFGFALFPLVGIPALLQLIFSIIGAVKANQGQWWNYPINIRLVR